MLSSYGQIPATRVAVLVPTLGRADKLPDLAKNILETGGTPYFIVEEADKDSQKPIENAFIIVGDFGTYAKAINHGYKNTVEPYLFAGADDLAFRKGWITDCMTKMGGNVKVVGTNDLGNPEVMAGDHATHYLVDRKYLDEQGGDFKAGPGSFLPEAYDHNWTDREFIETAKLRGVFAPCLESVVEHLNPLYGKSQADSTWEKTRRHTTKDKKTYESRMKERS